MLSYWRTLKFWPNSSFHSPVQGRLFPWGELLVSWAEGKIWVDPLLKAGLCEANAALGFYQIHPALTLTLISRVVLSGECLSILFWVTAGVSLVGIFKSCIGPDCCADHNELLFEVGICVPGVSNLHSIEILALGSRAPLSPLNYMPGTKPHPS